MAGRQQDKLIVEIYDEIEIEDMELEDGVLYYPCPCGDRFRITVEQLKNGENIAVCPSCSLKIEVIYEREDLSDTIVEMGGVPIAS